MTFRLISNLEYAAKCAQPPAPRANIKGSNKKATGLRYERQLARALPSAIHGQWFRFLDANGWGYCQPDFLLPAGPKAIIILECKYTWSPEAHLQLSQLYVPVVKRALGLPALPVVVCKNFRPDMHGATVFNNFDDLTEAVARPFNPVNRYVVHWMGAPTYVRRRNPPLTVKPDDVELERIVQNAVNRWKDSCKFLMQRIKPDAPA